MGTALARLLSSKGWNWFWLVWSLTFFVLDLLTGAIFGAVLMGLLSLLWGYWLRKKYQGRDHVYNQYHGKQV